MIARALARYGGALVRPRATFAALLPDEGRRDGLLFILLYAVGARLLPLGDAVADFAAMASFSALPTLLAGLAVLIPWLVATLGIEAILGPQRAHRTGLCMLPMLLVVTLARLAAGMGFFAAVPKYSVEIVGALLAAGLALRVRSAIAVTDASAPDKPRRASPAVLVVGALVLLVPLVSAVRDLADLADHWHTLAPVGVGATVPEFHAVDLDGASFTAADLRGKARLLVFFTSWCGVCGDEMPKYKALHQELGARGFEVIGINGDRDGDQAAIASRYRDANGLPFQIVLDRGALARAFRQSVYPHLVLVDRTGVVRWVHQGRVMDRALRGAIDDALTPAQ